MRKWMLLSIDWPKIWIHANWVYQRIELTIITYLNGSYHIEMNCNKKIAFKAQCEMIMIKRKAQNTKHTT